MTGRTILAVMLAVLLATSVSACGKKGDPKSPDGGTFPRQYPAPQ